MSNTSNRPSAVRTAGTVGRWGMTSFTSTRAIGKITGLESYSSHSNTSYMFNVADEDPSPAAVPSIGPPIDAAAPKPRKFFKSRATATQRATTPVPELPVPQQQSYAKVKGVHKEPATPKPAKTKHSKKKSTAIQEYFVQTPQPPPPLPEPVLIIPEPSVSQDRIRETIPSKRYLARARKVVNYNEDENSEPPPPPPSLPPPPAPAHHPTVPIMTVPLSAVSPSTDHPPIVLRISKGTSRLISTDSEEANNASPPHQTFASPSNGVKESPVPTTPPPASVTTTPKRGSGRKRRTPAAAAAAEVPPVVKDSPTPPGQPRRTTRAIQRQQEEEKLRSEQEQTAEEEEETGSVRPGTPLPGSANYELYRMLASSSPEVEKGEEEPEIVQTPVKVVPDPVPIVQKTIPAKRGRKKKTDTVGVAAAAPVASPVAVEKEIPVAKVEVEVAPEVPVTPSKPTPGRRGRKPKAAAVVVVAAVAVPVPVEEEEKKKKRAATPVKMVTPKKQQKVVKVEAESPSPRRTTRGAVKVTPTKSQTIDEEPRAGATASPTVIAAVVAPKTVAKAAPQPEPAKPVVRSYGRKRKGTVEVAEETTGRGDGAAITPTPTTRGKKVNGSSRGNVDNNNEDPNSMEVDTPATEEDVDDHKEDEKPLAKLVISKKKGSIFKSRALVSDAEVAKNRPVYKHKWDMAEEDRNSPKGALTGGDLSQEKTKTAEFEGDSGEPEAKPSSTVFKPHRRALLASTNTYGAAGNSKNNEKNKSVPWKRSKFNAAEEDEEDEDDDDEEEDSDVGTPKKQRNAFYTVKQAHQIQEIGEFQEMDDDVEYILDTLHPKYPTLTRCLSAMQLSSKCMTAEFRMHVRAHGTVTQFFSLLQDAPKDRSLGLCTAAIMFVLSQDNIGMDLDKDSLELMLNLLECDDVEDDEGAGLTEGQQVRNRMKVREMCEEVKTQGKAPHLNLDNITVGTLAMETLLSLTSKRAGEWFKEELRNLGGLEHIIKTVCECCQQISDYVAVWTTGLLEKLRKIERCLRVLENVMEMNEQNQNYILTYDKGNAINILVKLYKLCDTEIALYPTTALTPKDDPGVVIREALVPTLKVLISLTHPFNEKANGAMVVGEKVGIFDTSLHLLFHSSNYVPENCIFELSLLVLLLLINLTMHTPSNRTTVIEANALSDFGSQFAKVPAIKALVEFFYKCEESARLAEENADALLDANPKKEKSRKGDEIEETVTKILQKAGNHMEHTIMASYVCMLIGHLVMHNEEHRGRISVFLRADGGFGFMAQILEKYYNFMNLTASSEATAVAHIQSTKKIIDFLNQCDGK